MRKPLFRGLLFKVGRPTVPKSADSVVIAITLMGVSTGKLGKLQFCDQVCRGNTLLWI